jgi:signal transduction histidine kinase
MRKSDLLWAVALLAVGTAAGVLVVTGPPYRPVDAPAVGLAAAASLCLTWRRVAPIAVLVVASLLVIVNAAAGYAVVLVQWPVWIALFTCFSLGGVRTRLVALGVTLVGVAGWAAFDRAPIDVTELFHVAVVILVATVAGDAFASRRVVALTEQARMLAEERARLARELHDALGHAVNVMVMQAGVGRRVFTENPVFAQEALGHIERVGRDALGELDRLLRVMGPDDQPTPDLAELADQVRAAGREVLLVTEDVQLSASARRAVHRIVQEAVTNALRHTDSGRIEVNLAQIGDLVHLEVANETRGTSAGRPGHGLLNMRERARLEGGSLEAGPVEGGFRVRATLPARGRP